MPRTSPMFPLTLQPRIGVAYFAALLCLLPAGDVQADILWQGGFEGGTLGEWTGTLNPTQGARHNILIVDEPVRDGTQAASITIHEDDQFEPFNQNRVEVAHDGLRTQEGEDTYFSWFFMLPEEAQVRNNIAYWESHESYQNMMTFWVAPEGNATRLHFGTGFLGETERWSEVLTIGEWHHLAMHVRWSVRDVAGSVSVWYDGSPVVDAVNTRTKSDFNTMFIQMGLHRSDPAPPTETIYLDGALEAESVQEILSPLGIEVPGVGMPGSAEQPGENDGTAGNPTADVLAPCDGAAGNSGEADSNTTPDTLPNDSTPILPNATREGGCTVSVPQDSNRRGAAVWLSFSGLAVVTFRRRSRAGAKRRRR